MSELVQTVAKMEVPADRSHFDVVVACEDEEGGEQPRAPPACWACLPASLTLCLHLCCCPCCRPAGRPANLNRPVHRIQSNRGALLCLSTRLPPLLPLPACPPAEDMDVPLVSIKFR